MRAVNSELILRLALWWRAFPLPRLTCLCGCLATQQVSQSWRGEGIGARAKTVNSVLRWTIGKPLSKQIAVVRRFVYSLQSAGCFCELSAVATMDCETAK